MKTKEIAYFNTIQFNAVLSEMRHKIGTLQEFVDKYKLLGLKPLNGDELHELFYEPKKLLSKKLIEDKDLSISGLQFNSEKLIEIIEKPKEFDELIESLIKFSKDYAQNSFYPIRNFTVNDNIVIIDEKVIEKIKESNTIFIENENQKKAFKAVKTIEKELNVLKAINNFNINSLEKIVKENNNEFQLELSFLKLIK